MASLQELRKRLRTIQSTGQLAGAMRTAATAKYARLTRVRTDFGPYAQACRDMLRLSEQWFGEAEPDGSLGSMEEFVLSSGVYGSRQNALDRKLAEKGRLGYLLYELFIPADRIVYDYPVLEDKPYLLPVIRLRRLFDKTAGDPQLLKMNIKSLLRQR